MLLYSCNRCDRKDVTYQDWLPISPGIHWCKTCVVKFFDTLPHCVRGRAWRWLNGEGWETSVIGQMKQSIRMFFGVRKLIAESKKNA